jgi:hypothetical protein
MRISTDLKLQPISEIPEAVLTAIELQLQRALVADLMQRIAVLEYRLQRAERRERHAVDWSAARKG